MANYTKEEFKKYLESNLENNSFEEVSVTVSTENGEDTTHYFIKPYNICDSNVVLYGSYGGHVRVVNLMDFDIDEEVNNIIGEMSNYSEYQYYIMQGIDN